MHTAIALRKVGAGRALSLCWHAAQQQAPSPRARASVAEAGEHPDARGPDLAESRAMGSRTPTTALPRPPIRQRALTNLRHTSRGN